MHRSRSWTTRAVLLAASLLPCCLQAGCQKAPVEPAPFADPPPVPVAAPPGGVPPPLAKPMGPGMGGMMGGPGMGAGRTLFTIYCARCHTTGGPTAQAPNAPPADGKDAKQGPDLLRVAADPEHTQEWLVEQIRDPQAHKADSAMPKFGGRLRDKEIEAIAKYLSTMR